MKAVITWNAIGCKGGEENFKGSEVNKTRGSFQPGRESGKEMQKGRSGNKHKKREKKRG